MRYSLYQNISCILWQQGKWNFNSMKRQVLGRTASQAKMVCSTCVHNCWHSSFWDPLLPLAKHAYSLSLQPSVLALGFHTSAAGCGRWHHTACIQSHTWMETHTNSDSTAVCMYSATPFFILQFALAIIYGGGKAAKNSEAQENSSHDWHRWMLDLTGPWSVHCPVG